MTRKPRMTDAEWETPDNFTWGHIQLEVLMDIRQELRTIRGLLQCSNVHLGLVAMQKLDRHVRSRFPKKKKVTKPWPHQAPAPQWMRYGRSFTPGRGLFNQPDQRIYFRKCEPHRRALMAS